MPETLHPDQFPPSATTRAGSPARWVRRLLTRRAATSRAVAPLHPGLTGAQAPVLGAELHRLRRAGALVTIAMHGGYLHRGVRVEAVHRRHARLTDACGQRVLVPRAFIETVGQLGPATAGSSGG